MEQCAFYGETRIIVLEAALKIVVLIRVLKVVHRQLETWQEISKSVLAFMLKKVQREKNKPQTPHLVQWNKV